ncbi:MAG: hypothetical protein AOA65_1227 [Candidatus Bathyarchaeota archaeon BA1]|nr:MAG: hypothetical protein AOA65_1227 [Candidatus Bathyarchaeota archaeon BA1]
MKKLSPLYEDKYGILLCPYCNSPLLTEETREGEFKCILCGKYVDRLSLEVMMKMVDRFPTELLHEWMLETIKTSC